MSRWFRHYAGMMRDDKLVRVALRSKQPIERVCWVWGAILESAAEIDDGGRFDFDPDEAAWFLRADPSDLAAIVDALASAGRVAADHVVKWGDRQFASDRSRDRVAAHRERKRSEGSGCNGESPAGNGRVTLQERGRNSPETETETELEVVSDATHHSSKPQPVAEAVAVFNEAAVLADWPTAQKITSARDAAIKARLREYGIDGWRAAVSRARSSPFLGQSPPPQFFTFDWFVKQGNFQKITEGNYDRSRQANGNGVGRMAGPRPDPTLAILRGANAAIASGAGDYG